MDTAADNPNSNDNANGNDNNQSSSNNNDNNNNKSESKHESRHSRSRSRSRSKSPRRRSNSRSPQRRSPSPNNNNSNNNDNDSKRRGYEVLSDPEKSLTNDGSNWIRIRGFPFQGDLNELKGFFAPAQPIKMFEVHNANDRKTGEVLVQFGSESDNNLALTKNKQQLRDRKLEILQANQNSYLESFEKSKLWNEEGRNEDRRGIYNKNNHFIRISGLSWHCGEMMLRKLLIERNIIPENEALPHYIASEPDISSRIIQGIYYPLDTLGRKNGICYIEINKDNTDKYKSLLSLHGSEFTYHKIDIEASSLSEVNRVMNRCVENAQQALNKQFNPRASYNDRDNNNRSSNYNRDSRDYGRRDYDYRDRDRDRDRDYGRDYYRDSRDKDDYYRGRRSSRDRYDDYTRRDDRYNNNNSSSNAYTSKRDQEYAERKAHMSRWPRRPHLDSLIVRMLGIPFESSESDITNFFKSANVTPVRIHRKPRGGDAYLEFDNKGDVERAISRNKAHIGSRYIELYRVSYDEMAETVGLTKHNRDRSRTPKRSRSRSRTRSRSRGRHHSRSRSGSRDRYRRSSRSRSRSRS